MSEQRLMAEFVQAQSAEIQKAADRIRGYVRRTPTLRTDLDPELRLKAECFQIEIVTVSELEIATAVRVAWTRLHIALEPTGVNPLAAYLAGKRPGGETGLILSGGNANLETVAKLLGTQ